MAWRQGWQVRAHSLTHDKKRESLIIIVFTNQIATQIRRQIPLFVFMFLLIYLFFKFVVKVWIFKQFTLYISVKLWNFGHFHTFSLFTCSFSPWSDLFSDESKCVTENYVTMFSLLTGRMYLWWGAVFWTIGELREFMFSSRLVASLHRPLHIYGTFPHWEYKGYEAMRGFLALLCSHLHKWTPPRGEN